MREAAGDGNLSSIFDLIQVDEYGLVDFYDCFDKEFLKCLSACIAKNSNNLKKCYGRIDTDKYLKYIRVYNLWKYVCLQSSERIIEDLDEDYGNNIDVINEKNISEIENILLHFYKEQLIKPFSSSMEIYVKYYDEVKASYDKLLKIYQECKKGNFSVLQDLESEKSDDEEEDIVDILISEKYQERVRALLLGVASIIREFSEECEYENIAERVEFLSKKIVKFNSKLTSYLSLSNHRVDDAIRRFASSNSVRIYQDIISSVSVSSFNKNDYLDLIKSIRKIRKVMPGTISIVISEIIEVAKKDGIVFDDSLPFSFQVSDDIDLKKPKNK